MSTNIKLGQIIENEAFKDAIHVAVAPVVAGHTLKPGSHIGFYQDGTVGCTSNDRSEPHPVFIGIVDPFIKQSIQKGEKFWMILYPNTVTGLRHEWDHPAFKSSEKSEHPSKKWIEELAESVGITYNRLMSSAEERIERGYEIVDDRVYDEFPGDKYDEFWVHYKNVTGENGKGRIFSETECRGC